ncbi:M28 family metallopeptidase [Hymenobacter sp. BT491]|uniref:M28 family metallopeptidase n=1 Tax=Hymenobacter sp. BT491 TaxID=2766779 RepID=UPI001653B31E|nr:M28 family peptidase [Hymenobacter sp. BT491]MBC6991003.1 M20/M25/M40 family metallo-hydrolase [Hymenobacter sp. BT491]
MRQTISDLTAPAMHGRGYVQQGEHKAAAYIRQRFEMLGLQPFTPNYQQPFSLTVNTFPGRMALRAGSKMLRPGKDFIAEPNSGGGKAKGAVLYLDTLIFTNETAGTRFLRQELRHRIVVLRQRDAERIRTLPDSFAQHLDEAAARITLVSKLTASLSEQQAHQPRLHVLASSWPAPTQYASTVVQAILRPNYPTKNIIGYLPGSVSPDSFIVVTAHYDHLGHMGRRTYFPGANDNASGTAMLLELAAYYAQRQERPTMSIVFMAFGAEEAGLIGSHYFVDHPLFPLDRIRFLINLDLLGTGSDGITVVNGRQLAAPYHLLQQLNDSQHFVNSIAARGRAANSDHFYFSERGVPAFFIYTRGGIAAYHDVDDRAETLPLTAFSGVFKLLVEFVDKLLKD